MPRQLLAALASAAFAAPAFADPVTLVFQPAVGSEWRIEETRTLTRNSPGQPGVVAGTITARIKVLEEQDDGFVMEWTVETIGGNLSMATDSAYPQALIGAPIRFFTDLGGLPLEVLEPEALVEKVLATPGDIITSPNDRAMAKLVRDIYAAGDPTAMVNLLLPQARTLGACQGFSIDPAEPIKEPVTAPNLAGGPDMEGEMVTRMEDAGSPTRPAQVRISETYDPDSARATVLSLLNQLDVEKSKEGLDVIRSAEMTRTMETLCTVDVPTGVARRVMASSLIKIGPVERRDMRLLVVTPLPPA